MRAGSVSPPRLFEREADVPRARTLGGPGEARAGGRGGSAAAGAYSSGVV